jgi:signal peptidase II
MQDTVFQKYLTGFLAVLGGIALDQITKHVVQVTVSPWNPLTVLCWLSITPSYNTGVSWGLFAKTGKTSQALLIVLSCVLIMIFAQMWWKENKKMSQVGFIAIISGALGNLIDRIRFGGVFDFLNVHWHTLHFPVFNVADMLISVGFLMLLRDYYQCKR